MSKKTLIIVTHPDLANSRANNTIVTHLAKNTTHTIHKLYDVYPDGKIDVDAEQKLLSIHDNIVLLFPIYWYSSPSLLKEWQDAVLTYGFAYGSKGDALANKNIMLCCTNGSSQNDYEQIGKGQIGLNDLLLPFDWTFTYCKMNYKTPFIIYDTGSLQEQDLVFETDKLIQTISSL